ncbi:MAG: glycosyltransferase family 2 protein [Candidatus Aenigmatarchaeota archaeon]
MKENPIVSILISVHNEEKIIEKTLSNLERIRNKEYRNLEVIVGTDSDDKTEAIVRKRFKWVRIVSSKIRLGKAGMLTKMYKVAKGEILIIHDADWILDSQGKFKNIIEYFKDPKIGGLNNNRIPSEMNIHPLCLGEGLTYTIVRDYNILKNSEYRDGRLVEKMNSSFPFMVDIFRSHVIPGKQFTLCDDGERSVQLRKNGYVVAIGGDDVPNFKVDYSNIPTVGKLMKHGVRRAVARNQVKSIYGQFNAGILSFYLPAFLYGLAKSKSPKIFLSLMIYWMINLVSTIKGKTTSFSTREGWKIRFR